MSLIREQTAAIAPSRALWVPFMLGRPFGVPNDAPFQRKVLLALLRLFEAKSGPLLEDFAEDAPADPAQAEGYACPVSFARASAHATPADALDAEVGQLRSWYDLAVRRRGRTTVGISGMAVEDAARFIAAHLGETPPPAPDPSLPRGASLKRACDDLKAYYFEAAAAQPGNLSARDIDHWFWHDTAAAKVYIALQPKLLASADKSMQWLGRQSLVPRAIYHTLVQSHA